MGRHLLGPGKSVIAGLRALGEALGYYVETDKPLLPPPRHRQELDVAWFAEKGQRYPLMIFEVESAATNAATANPTKVFAKPNEVFEKPLFFFHVFLKVGPDSTRVDDLRDQFGMHNYRAYHLTPESVGALVADILAQHRRIRPVLPVERVVEALSLPCWMGVDPAAVVRTAESLNFEGGTHTALPAYVRQSRTSPAFWSEVLRVLRDREAAGTFLLQGDDYGTYIGDVWPDAVYAGILATESPGEEDRYLALLRRWQEKAYDRRAIAPDFGLSSDYDDFLVDAAAPYWALIAALFRNHGPAVDYVAAQLGDLLDPLLCAQLGVAMFTGLWALHVGVEAHSGNLFDTARGMINGRGGVPSALLSTPPSTRPAEDDWITTAGPLALVPPRTEFAGRLHRTYPADRVRCALDTAREVLVADAVPYGWAPRIVEALH